MTTQNNTLSTLFKKNLNEFVSIWSNDRKDYSFDGVETSEIAFKSQNWAVESSNPAYKTQAKTAVASNSKAEEPLEWTMKLTLFFMPLKAFMRSALYAMRGYNRKAKECIQWCYYGFGFYMLLVVVSLL